MKNFMRNSQFLIVIFLQIITLVILFVLLSKYSSDKPTNVKNELYGLQKQDYERIKKMRDSGANTSGVVSENIGSYKIEKQIKLDPISLTLSKDLNQEILVSDPVAAVKAVLPDGWVILKVEENTYPSYRPKGNGKAIFLGLKEKKYSKQQYSAVLFLMPKDYNDGGSDPTKGQAQTWPARLIAITQDTKIYLWPRSQAEDWETMQQDLLKALIVGLK